jgi:hypothetical protein
MNLPQGFIHVPNYLPISKDLYIYLKKEIYFALKKDENELLIATHTASIFIGRL